MSRTGSWCSRRDRSIPAPRKRDSIAREAELLLTNFDLAMRAVRARACGSLYRRCVGLNGRVDVCAPCRLFDGGGAFFTYT